MSSLPLTAYVYVRCLALSGLQRVRSDERGEGVISAAIAVLIMAFLGVAMWVAFKGMFTTTTTKTTDQVSLIGS